MVMPAAGPAVARSVLVFRVVEGCVRSKIGDVEFICSRLKCLCFCRARWIRMLLVAILTDKLVAELSKASAYFDVAGVIEYSLLFLGAFLNL
ncbi:hypothetical protein PR202_gb27905 [Eleusine coracana subsp. coracana]|uniref:Secreted protein n=1 Tax=Eleusine coracana subsp. coracana TaxID=191504 RepID=A0AAV5FVP7_ELECO|nr:hypothetical protein PR202_gb27905 [Eleusine coracana subsp. coracana]